MIDVYPIPDTDKCPNRSEFVELSTNPGEVRWAQAVNSLSKLSAKLYDDTIDIIESDVIRSSDGEPIAAHPPATTSDLTISHLVETISATEKGVIFDFKDPLAVEPTLAIAAQASLSQLVLLNADVLNTDEARKAKIDPDWFIGVCSEQYSRGVLSLGWRTSGKPGSVYTQSNVREMIELCSGIETVTHPVRAAMLPGSWEHIKQLIEAEGRTLKIWNTGPIDDQLKQWIKTNTDPSKCFYTVDLN